VQCYRGAIIRLEAAWCHRLAWVGEATCRPAVVCYQTPTDNDRRQRAKQYWPTTLCVGRPVINSWQTDIFNLFWIHYQNAIKTNTWKSWTWYTSKAGSEDLLTDSLIFKNCSLKFKDFSSTVKDLRYFKHFQRYWIFKTEMSSICQYFTSMLWTLTSL